MQINIATGEAVVYAFQNRNPEKAVSSSKRERLERYIMYLKEYLQKHDDVDEQTRKSFEEDIVETEEELRQLEK